MTPERITEIKTLLRNETWTVSTEGTPSWSDRNETDPTYIEFLVQFGGRLLKDRPGMKNPAYTVRVRVASPKIIEELLAEVERLQKIVGQETEPFLLRALRERIAYEESRHPGQ